MRLSESLHKGNKRALRRNSTQIATVEGYPAYFDKKTEMFWLEGVEEIELYSSLEYLRDNVSGIFFPSKKKEKVFAFEWYSDRGENTLKGLIRDGLIIGIVVAETRRGDAKILVKEGRAKGKTVISYRVYTATPKSIDLVKKYMESRKEAEKLDKINFKLNQEVWKYTRRKDVKRDIEKK